MWVRCDGWSFYFYQQTNMNIGNYNPMPSHCEHIGFVDSFLEYCHRINSTAYHKFKPYFVYTMCIGTDFALQHNSNKNPNTFSFTLTIFALYTLSSVYSSTLSEIDLIWTRKEKQNVCQHLNWTLKLNCPFTITRRLWAVKDGSIFIIKPDWPKCILIQFKSAR